MTVYYIQVSFLFVTKSNTIVKTAERKDKKFFFFCLDTEKKVSTTKSHCDLHNAYFEKLSIKDQKNWGFAWREFSDIHGYYIHHV